MQRQVSRASKSYYYDKETNCFGQATAMPSYPSARPHRYTLIVRCKHLIGLKNKAVQAFIKKNNIQNPSMIKRKLICTGEDLPF